MTPEEEKEYKEKQKIRISALKAGALDQNANSIVKIFGRGDEYVVYEIESKEIVESVKVYIDNVTEKDESKVIERYNKIRIKFVEIKGYLYKSVDKSAIKTIIAQILIHGIIENPDEAIRQFEDLKEQIDKDYKEQFSNKMRLLFSSLSLTILLIIFSILTNYCKWFSATEHLKNLIFVCTAGSIGGFFSISMGLKKIICEKEVGPGLYVAYGIERVIISILAATIIYFAIKADVIFGNFNSISNPLIGYILIAFVAGFSETLVPNLMKKLEKEQ
jgi:hypothetical protein